ncbi:MAG: carboxypeptidase-like regulatory domain-containing protein, partial [Flavobacterium sp.]
MINKVVFILLVAMTQTTWSQIEDRAIINGRITSNTSDLDGVYVVNAQTEAMATTDASGAFSIAAKPGETLIFSSIQFKENRVLLTQENFSDLNFTVKLNMVMHQLQEVVVRNYGGINAVS